MRHLHMLTAVAGAQFDVFKMQFCWVLGHFQKNVCMLFLPAEIAALLITGSAGTSHVSCAMGLCSRCKRPPDENKLLLCHPRSETSFCHLKSSLCVSKREGEGKPWWGMRDQRGAGELGVGAAAGLGVHPLRRLLHCQPSPKPIEDAGVPIQASVVGKLGMGVFSERS